MGDKDLSEYPLRIADDCVKQVFSKYLSQTTYGDYISAISILMYNTAVWVAEGMNLDVKEPLNAMFAGAVQLETLHNAEDHE